MDCIAAILLVAARTADAQSATADSPVEQVVRTALFATHDPAPFEVLKFLVERGKLDVVLALIQALRFVNDDGGHILKWCGTGEGMTRKPGPSKVMARSKPTLADRLQRTFLYRGVHEIRLEEIDFQVMKDDTGAQSQAHWYFAATLTIRSFSASRSTVTPAPIP